MDNILITKKIGDYELLDCGDGEKLERFGNRVLRRPDPQAIWSKSLNEEDWSKANAVFIRSGKIGKWQKDDSLSEEWDSSIGEYIFSLKLLPSKHVGVFPEQYANWKWLEEKIKSKTEKGEKVSVLNLFAYTGGATMACIKAGANVCHVDASKFVINYAGENIDKSKLDTNRVRFIIDDVRKFVEREIKRGVKYDLIIMDPPVYGKGSNSKVWNLESDLIPLVQRSTQILSSNPIAFLLNGYSSVYSHITYRQALSCLISKFGGVVSSGELIIEDSLGKLLPAGIFSRWEK